MDNIIVCSDGSELTLEHLYTVEDYLTYNIKIKSGEFSGASNFCMSRDNVVMLIEELTKMHNELKGSCELKDYDSDANIIIEMDKLGHLFIYGQIGGSHEEQSLKFKMNSDQTVLEELKNIFKKSCK